MNLQKIENLIKKYENGETSIEEEQQLKAFFLFEDVPIHLRSYSDIFTFFDISGKEKITNPDFDAEFLKAIEADKVVPIAATGKRKIYTLVAMAATVLLLVGLYFKYSATETMYQDTFEDPKLAYAETKKVLMMVSGNLNDGVSELKNVSEFNRGLESLNTINTFETGIKNLEKISILDKSKEIITSKK